MTSLRDDQHAVPADDLGDANMLRKVIAIVAAAAGIVLCVAYALRLDWWTALTVAPAWLWLPIGAAGLFGRSRAMRLAATLPWVVFTVAFVEEPRSLIRGLVSTGAEPDAKTVHVVSLNVSGEADAVRSALRSGAEIICIQESPGQESLAGLLLEFPDYSFVCGIDASVLAKGRIEPISLGRHFVTCAVEVHGMRIAVSSLRLATMQPRYELWSVDVWKSQMHTRRLQREQMKEVLASLPTEGVAVVAGDFNVPQGDRVTTLLTPQFSDAFHGAGRGVCNTITSEMPLLRIDQIWVRGLRSADLRASPVGSTDHRMVTASLVEDTN